MKGLYEYEYCRWTRDVKKLPQRERRERKDLPSREDVVKRGVSPTDAMEQGRPEDLFELLEQLGKGSYGAVYKVRSPHHVT